MAFKHQKKNENDCLNFLKEFPCCVPLRDEKRLETLCGVGEVNIYITVYISLNYSNQLDRKRVWTFGSGPRMCVGHKLIHRIIKVKCARLDLTLSAMYNPCALYNAPSVISHQCR